MSLFACCIRRNHRRVDETNQQTLIREPPEISWENSLGAPNGVPFDDDTKDLLRKCIDVCTPSPTTLAQIIKRSEAFPIKFPINTMRCSALRERGISTDILEINANSVYPLIHEAMLPLIARWLKHKRTYGSAIERAMYKDMGLIQFIHRLLEKRAVHFFGSDDQWKLIDGKTGVDGWENVGTDHEKEPLVLTKCLSYDEIKLSAMLAMSSHSDFINDGSRDNRGIVTTDSASVQPRGVIIGAVGTRFERPRVMEYQDILITPLQNNMENGYGPPTDNPSDEKRGLRVLWAKFYGEEYHPLYEETVKRIKSKENKRYLSLTSQTVFDIENYMKRTLLTVEIILLEANTRAEKQNTTAFLHVVGLGLGVWRIIEDQEMYYLKTFEIAIRKMNKKLKYISDIMFAYFRQQKCGDVGNGDYLGDIRIHFALREPHSKLFRPTDANKLLVVTYAWDGNALPGNEFWSGYLASSGDPAAACSSQITELHTSRINPRACGASLHVASAEHGILHISDYSRLHLSAGPLGAGQRRPSRSPRSQRSRSADVDCLKKYTERRVEERRHTEIPDTSKLDPSKWIPLPKNISRSQPTVKKSPQLPRDEEKRRSVNSDAIEMTTVGVGTGTGTEPAKSSSSTPKKTSPTREEQTKSTEEKTDTRPATTYRATAGRSYSTDVSVTKSEKIVEGRRHTECSDPRTIATRWIPQINTSRFLYDASPFARISNTCEITKNAATRWMTFVKNPSPCPLPRMYPERKSSAGDVNKADDSEAKEVKKESPKWEPLRKFSPVMSKSNRETNESQDDSEQNRDLSSTQLCLDSSEQSSRLSQRMRDLYDFKTENEWPKRATNPRRDNTWISKSSSEDEKNHLPARRNSQDLEFNDRVNQIKLKDTKVRSDVSKEPGPSKPAVTEGSEVFNDEYEERLRKFNERLRYSEDLGLAKPRIKERRTYSDDYDEKARRASRGDVAQRRTQTPTLIPESDSYAEKKRNSDASTRSRGSYAEINPVKRDSRTSDVSYASIANYSAKRGSVECKSTRQMFELPPRRAFSQTEERAGTPSTPVPPKEWSNDRFVAMKLMSERQKRDSTRYKVYLT